MRNLEIPSQDIRVLDEADLVVVGAGPAGVAAAIAAGRAGISVVVIEKNGFCGGVAGMGLPIQGFDDWKEKPLVRGIAWEIYRRLCLVGGASEPLVPCGLHNPYAIIDPELFKLIIAQMLKESGVRLWNHVTFLQCRESTDQKHPGTENSDSRGKQITHVIVGGKEGLAAFRGRYFVDASGDGDVAASIGVPFTVGRQTDGLPQSATVNFILEGVDFARLGEAVRANKDNLFDTHPLINRENIINGKPHIMVGLRNLIALARRESPYEIPCDYASYITGLSLSSAVINMVHVHHASGHTIDGFSMAEQAGREQIIPLIRFFNEWVPGFRDARLKSVSACIGIRETRHIQGSYTLTGEDVTCGRFFPDTIALGGYPIDIHHPEKGDVELQKVPPYGIPYRSLVPTGVENLIVPGRALSADHVALASCRLMATCMAMGQAAGTATTLALRKGSRFDQVDITELRDTLVRDGAILEGKNKNKWIQ